MTYLLDTNALIALCWPSHPDHRRVVTWWTGITDFATCPITQLGLVRISPVAGYAADVALAMRALKHLTIDARHAFWACDVALDDPSIPIARGPQQLTDAYLVGIAAKNRGKLATLDQGISRLQNATAYVELL